MIKTILSEFLGTILLLATVVGSGIMGETLSGGNIAIALLANALATGAMLFVLISVFGPTSGAHFNPAVTAAMFMTKRISGRTGFFYCLAQIVGALCGVWLAHLMFDQSLFQVSTKIRWSQGQWWSEFVASFGLLLTILALLRNKPDIIPQSVALYIVGAYWFTASTSFANPAVTLARSLTNSFSGIAPACIFAFILAQCLGTVGAVFVAKFLFDEERP
jgi:glycerol uptake facilitator-like aquaporin